MGYAIRWKVVPLFTDAYAPPRIEDPSREVATTLAQGLSNTRHTLEIVAEKPLPLRAIRVYRPPLTTPDKP